VVAPSVICGIEQFRLRPESRFCLGELAAPYGKDRSSHSLYETRGLLRFGRPSIIAVVVTDSGIVLARANADTDARCVLGSYSDVLRNWMRLISTAGLSQREFMEAQSLFAEKVGFPGPTDA
jgi:hypothetical protein